MNIKANDARRPVSIVVIGAGNRANKYLEYAKSKEDYDFIQNEIYPKLEEIITAYKNGTDFFFYLTGFPVFSLINARNSAVLPPCMPSLSTACA